MKSLIFQCPNCTVSCELTLEEPLYWFGLRHTPKIFECPSCGNNHYIRDTYWIKEVSFEGEKICCGHSEVREKFYRHEFNCDLDAKEVYKILLEKGITYFHHANTIRTSITYLKEGALLSRGYIEAEALYQTLQESDAIDKKYGIWNHLFLDALDLGGYFGKPNVYGPVLFKFDMKLLLSEQIPTIRISKQNPHYWREGDCLNSRYYTDIGQFKKEYRAGNKMQDGRTMFIFTTLGGKLDFGDWLKEVSIDDPQLIVLFDEKNRHLIELLCERFEPFVEKNGVSLKINKRFRFAYNNMFRFKNNLFTNLFSTKFPEPE